MKELTVWEVGKIFSKEIPQLGKRGFCPFRKHRRIDKSFRVFRSSSTGDVLYRCYSCDGQEAVGDAVGLYAVLSGVDRKTAWNDLRERGYRVPGAEDGPRSRDPREHTAAPAKSPPVPVQGRDQRHRVLPFDQDEWRRLSGQRLGAVERFAKMRGLPADRLRKLDVVDVRPDVVGFGYRDPYTRIPCRVKCRPLERKTFWIEPRPRDGEDAKALSPLHLASFLSTPMQFGRGRSPTTYHAVVTEGEVDSITLRCLGFRNVVSLPDGCLSAGTVSVEPISFPFGLWLIATDADEDGDEAYVKLRERAWALNIVTARVKWRSGDVTHKDANDALLSGMTRDAFESCLVAAGEAALGMRIAV